MNAREKALLVVSELREALARIPLGLTDEVCDVLLGAEIGRASCRERV